jgi:hypothetical protein
LSWSRSPYREHVTVIPESQYGFLPCAPGCRGSASDPRYCQCVCQGINHGLLLRPVKIERPVPIPHGLNPAFPFHQLPELPEPKPEPKPIVEKERLIFPVARGTKKLLKKLTGYTNANEINETIVKGLRYQFNQERTDAIINQAFTIRMQHDPYQNQPELYELYETGDIDRALEHFSIRWVTGRPKRRKR